MSDVALSIIVPGRAEEFMARTVAGVLAHTGPRTEVIAVIDGEARGERVAEHPRLQVVELPQPLGQRGAQNAGVRIARGRYVMKLDAHCLIEPGMDEKLLAVMQDDITLVPMMCNLHAYNWVCQHCGMDYYQGPVPTECRSETCDGQPPRFAKQMVWQLRANTPHSTAYRFNKSLRFKYFPELERYQPAHGLGETLSLQGSCFMASREMYWARELCDEKWGAPGVGWGQQGSEVALKTWLSGGRVLCLKDTYYAHMFRVKAGDAFPYAGTASSQRQAIDTCQSIFLNDAWPKQTRPLAWLLDRFWPALQDVRDREERWDDADLERLKAQAAARGFRAPAPRARTGGLVYYTDNRLDEALAGRVRGRLAEVSRDRRLPLVSASLKRLSFGVKNVWFHSHKPGQATMLRQIVGALENSRADYVFMTEHDVLYHPSHFDFIPSREDTFYYNTHVYHVRYPDGHAVYWDNCQQVSGCCANRLLLLDFYRQKLAQVEAAGHDRHYEPGLKQSVGGQRVENWQSEYPNLDVRHGANLTPSKWAPSDFRHAGNAAGWREVVEIPGWGHAGALFGQADAVPA